MFLKITGNKPVLVYKLFARLSLLKLNRAMPAQL